MYNNRFNIDGKMFTSPSTSSLNQNIHQVPNNHQFNRSYSISPSYTTSPAESFTNHSPMSNFASPPCVWPYAQNDDIDICEASSSSFSDDEPRLQILIQPKPLFQYRYRSEMKANTADGEIHSSHGSLIQRDYDGNECSPTVRLLNFTGTAIIRCFLYQSLKNGEIKLHPNCLWRKRENGTTEFDPIYAIVNEANNWTAEFTKLSIIRIKQADIRASLITKQINQMKYGSGYSDLDFENKIDLDRVVMGFEAFDQRTSDQTYKKIAGPEFSIQIKDSKSTSTGLLKICDHLPDVGAVWGNEKMFMFCKKVDKDDIKVIFAEPHSSWKVTLSPEKVHYQYGIVLRTPPYHDQNIDKDATVQIMLYRPRDEAISEPCHFTYRSIASMLRDYDAFTSKVEDLALALMPGDNLRFDAASGKRSQAKNGPTITDSNRERMFLELCTGLSLPKHSEIPKNSQHLNSNSPCYIAHTGVDSDDTGSEHSDKSFDGSLATPTEPEESESKETNDANESNQTELTQEEQAELTDLLNKLTVAKSN